MTPFEYQAEVLRVIDGDTIEVEVDLGFRLYSVQRFRLLRVDTPELRGGTDESKAEARRAKVFVEEWLADSSDHVLIRTEKADSFGRWLAEVENPMGDNLNDALIAEGWGEASPLG